MVWGAGNSLEGWNRLVCMWLGGSVVSLTKRERWAAVDDGVVVLGTLP